MRSNQLLRELRRTIGLRQRRPFGRFNIDVVLRCARLWKERESNRRNQRNRTHHHEGCERQRPFRGGERAMQQRRIGRMNAFVERTQHAIPFGMLCLGKHVTREPGNDRQRHEQRRQHGVHNGNRQRAYVATSQARQEQQREERKDQRCRRAENSDRDLFGSGNRGVTTRDTTAHESRDVFDDDNRIVDQ